MPTPEELETARIAQEAEVAKAAEAEKAKKVADADELLKSLKLKDSELEALKGNENLLGILTHSIDAKRTANAEAKKNREALEALQSEATKAEKEKLEKKGEFEKLYKDSQEQITAKDAKLKEALVKGELSRLAGANGLAKVEYLKLLDKTSIEVDLETLTVTGAEEAFKTFKESSPELFGKPVIPGTDTGQPGVSKGAPQGDLEKLKQLKLKAESTTSPRDIGAYRAFKIKMEA